jgi:DNA polymerase III epsilon subunit-like protein
MLLFFDTETTGKADFQAAPDAAHQPRLVQFAALLTDANGKELASANLVIKPNGFTIPREASEIHGITTEHALAVGVDCAVARHLYRAWWNAAATIIAHNIEFDLLIMDGELFRHAGGRKAWGAARETFCTMRAMTPVCKLPGTYGRYKWPRLQEAHKHCFGVEFDGAHDALADVRACARVYWWLNRAAGANGEEGGNMREGTANGEGKDVCTRGGGA